MDGYHPGYDRDNFAAWRCNANIIYRYPVVFDRSIVAKLSIAYTYKHITDQVIFTCM